MIEPKNDDGISFIEILPIEADMYDQAGSVEHSNYGYIEYLGDVGTAMTTNGDFNLIGYEITLYKWH